MATHHCMHCDCANFKHMPCCLCLRIKGEEGKLTEHAKREVKFLKTEDWLSNGLVQMVRAFDSMGHPLAKRFVLPLLTDLINGDILAPITDDPEEWEFIEEGHWRSLRSTDTFSDNGGKTYFLVSESRANPQADTKFYESAKSGAANTQMTFEHPYLDTKAVDMSVADPEFAKKMLGQIDPVAIQQAKDESPNISTPEAVEKSQDDISGD
jgi:hypothetical protein